MTLAELTRELRRHAVRLSMTVDGQLKVDAPTRPPDTVMDGIRTHRAALLQMVRADPVLPLPESLRRLVQAAVSPGLNYPAALPRGHVSNLGDFVLACAALYAAGVESERQLEDLWAARMAWAT